MISLDKARELKEAGLKWKPRYGDRVRGADMADYIIVSGEIKQDGFVTFQTQKNRYSGTGFVWVPSLSQLLAEIEARGYWWEFRAYVKRYEITLFKRIVDIAYDCDADTPEDAAAAALLWILEQEATSTHRDPPWYIEEVLRKGR